jgi:hypothetical protein
MTEFDQFWAVYPRHVKKLAAMKAFTKARTFATLEDILAGVERYKQIKPAYADWAHAPSWLNAGRWMDEADAVPVKADDYGHVPPCRSYAECLAKRLGRNGTNG